MPQMVPVVLNDGKPTPLAHTFTPEISSSGKANWANRSATIARGSELLLHTFERPNSKTQPFRIGIKLNLPTVSVINGVDTVVRESKAEVIFYLSQDSTQAERKDVRALLANALANPLVVTSVENLEAIY